MLSIWCFQRTKDFLMRPPTIGGSPVGIPVSPTSCQGFSPPFAPSPFKVDINGSFGAYYHADNLNRAGLSPETGILHIRSDFPQSGSPTADDRCDTTVQRFLQLDYSRPKHVKNQPFRPFERISIDVVLSVEQFTHHLNVDNDLLNAGSGVVNLVVEMHVIMPNGETLKRPIAARTIQARADMGDYTNVLPGGFEGTYSFITSQAHPVTAPVPISAGVFFTHQARANTLRMESVVELRARFTSIKVCSRRALTR
jgi:hypothetical protein